MFGLTLSLGVGTPLLFTSSLAAQQSAKPENPPPPSQVPKRRSLWQALLDLLNKQNEPPLTSRGNVCLLTPSTLGRNLVWNDRLLFIWQGNVQSVELRPYSATQVFAAQPILWSVQSMGGRQQVAYTGAPLQPGQFYDIQVVPAPDPQKGNGRGNPNPIRINFQVMDLTERERVGTELAALTARLKTSGANEEAIALERSKYFASQGLWSDALHEIYSFSSQSVSTDVKAAAQEISSSLCSG
jgi:hypothetical protein